ncbi:hypothetical protein PR048_032591, partial [Dryococelus australis]
MPLVGGFSRGSPVSPALSFRHCSITVIGSRPRYGAGEVCYSRGREGRAMPASRQGLQCHEREGGCCAGIDLAGSVWVVCVLEGATCLVTLSPTDLASMPAWAPTFRTALHPPPTPTTYSAPTCLPPRRTGFNPRPGHSGFARGNSAGRCRWSANFLGDIPPFPSHQTLHSSAAPLSPHFTLIGSQDLVKRPLVLTQSRLRGNDAPSSKVAMVDSRKGKYDEPSWFPNHRLTSYCSYGGRERRNKNRRKSGTTLKGQEREEKRGTKTVTLSSLHEAMEYPGSGTRAATPPPPMHARCPHAGHKNTAGGTTLGYDLSLPHELRVGREGVKWSDYLPPTKANLVVFSVESLAGNMEIVPGDVPGFLGAYSLERTLGRVSRGLQLINKREGGRAVRNVGAEAKADLEELSIGLLVIEVGIAQGRQSDTAGGYQLANLSPPTLAHLAGACFLALSPELSHSSAGVEINEWPDFSWPRKRKKVLLRPCMLEIRSDCSPENDRVLSCSNAPVVLYWETPRYEGLATCGREWQRPFVNQAGAVDLANTGESRANLRLICMKPGRSQGRLACSPPKANRVLSPGQWRCSAGFLEDLLFPPAPSFRRCSMPQSH